MYYRNITLSVTTTYRHVHIRVGADALGIITQRVSPCTLSNVQGDMQYCIKVHVSTSWCTVPARGTRYTPRRAEYGIYNLTPALCRAKILFNFRKSEIFWKVGDAFLRVLYHFSEILTCSDPALTQASHR